MRKTESTVSYWLTMGLITLSALHAVWAEDFKLYPRTPDFTYLSWDAAPPYFQGHPEKADQPRILWIETGNYSMALDTRRLGLPHAGSLPQIRSAAFTGDRMKGNALPPGSIKLLVIADGAEYVSEGLRSPTNEWTYPVRFVETGRWFQHVDLDGILLRSRDGRILDADAHLEIAAWPDRATFFAEVHPHAQVTNLRVRLEVTAAGMNAQDAKNDSNRATVTLLAPSASIDQGPIPLVESTAGDQFKPITIWRPELDAWEIKIEGTPWNNPLKTYYPANHLDRLDRWPVTLQNDSAKERLVRMVFTRTSFTPITGLTPMWLDKDGFPTGLPVQLSKNWHAQPARGHLRHEGPWLRASSVIRVPPRSSVKMDFALCYARYGEVFAASHAQLSLVGWGHNTFWDEAAIGSFGETMCFEPGRVQRRCFITDVRPFLVVHPPKTNRWEWTSNVGGGDFLVYFDENKKYVPFIRTRTDYHSPGPLLTRTTYSETSANESIAAKMTVSLPGAQDHARVLMHLRYDVLRDARFSRLAFLQFGSDFYNAAQPKKIAVGNAKGLIEEWTPGQGSWKYDRRDIVLDGYAPWISAHDEQLDGSKSDGGGTRGLIIRGWRARLGGKQAGPYMATYLTEDGPKRFRTALELAPPPDLTTLKAGDFVEADLEWRVFPRQAQDYYGPDNAFRESLQSTANTWKPVHREATQNEQQIQTAQGKLVSSSPARIRVDSRQRATFTLARSTGHVPVTFTGLRQPHGYSIIKNGIPIALSSQGNYWQAEFDESTRLWSLTCLIPAEKTSCTYAFGPFEAGKR